MISIAISGNSVIIWKNWSLEIARVVSSFAARTVAVRGTSIRMAISAHQVVLGQGRYLERAAGRIDQDLGPALDDDERLVADIALVEQLLAAVEGQPLAGKGEQLVLGGLDLGEERDLS